MTTTMITRKCLWTLLCVTLLILASCQKTPDPAPQPDPTPTPHHNTTYVWGGNNWDNVWPDKTKNVAKSADSTLVDYVYLKNDGVALGGMLARDILGRMNTIVESVAPANRAKVRGTGTLRGAGIANAQDVNDSTKLVEFGFVFADTQHPRITTYIWGANNWDNVWPDKTDNVAKSADSTLVNNVFLKNDGVSFDGMLARDILGRMNTIVESVAPANRTKVRGTGTLNGAGIVDAQDVNDSTKLVEFGFAFADAIHPHATTYIWGANNWNNVWPDKTDNVAKSADSTFVNNVFLKNDGVSMDGMLARDILGRMNTIVESVAPANRAKVRGTGTLRDAGIANAQDVNDSTKLVEFGFTFANTIRPHATTYVWGVNNWDNVWPNQTDNVAKSADSTLVNNVYLKNDGVALGGMLAHDILGRMNTIVESVAPANRAKVRGTGTLRDAGIASAQDVNDSTKLVEFGFVFADTQHSHNTYYIFGVNNWDNIAPEKTDNVAKSADSTLVNNVFLKNDGVSFDEMLARDIFGRINPVVESVPSVNRHKVRGTGTLRNVGIVDAKDVNDSTKLAELGFAFTNAIHPHTTTYVWGKNNTANVYPADNITKSVDSLMVSKVFLENDGKSWDGSSISIVLGYVNKILDDVKSDNKYKIRGAGTLNDVYIRDEQARQDSTTLAQMGFKFGRVVYPQQKSK